MPFRIRRGTFGAAVFLLAITGLVAGTLWYSRSTREVPAATTPAAGVDFSRDLEANYAAAQGNLWSELPRFASYAGAKIVRDGLEVDLVGPPTDALRAVVVRDGPQYQGKPIPIHYRSVRHSQQQLQAVADRIEADDGYWRQRGIELTGWGPDIDSNTVQIMLAHYSKANQDALLARYGNDLVSVLPEDVVARGS